jgi:hypothetical protein
LAVGAGGLHVEGEEGGAGDQQADTTPGEVSGGDRGRGPRGRWIVTGYRSEVRPRQRIDRYDTKVEELFTLVEVVGVSPGRPDFGYGTYGTEIVAANRTPRIRSGGTPGGCLPVNFEGGPGGVRNRHVEDISVIHLDVREGDCVRSSPGVTNEPSTGGGDDRAGDTWHHGNIERVRFATPEMGDLGSLGAREVGGARGTVAAVGGAYLGLHPEVPVDAEGGRRVSRSQGTDPVVLDRDAGRRVAPPVGPRPVGADAHPLAGEVSRNGSVLVHPVGIAAGHRQLGREEGRGDCQEICVDVGVGDVSGELHEPRSKLIGVG